MAITTRYFGVTGQGTADGTSWANRAALFTGGAWSTVITGFNFTSGGNSLKCVIEAGTHTITATLQSSSFTSGTPTVADPLIFVSANADGSDEWVPPDPDWTSAEPAWTDTGMAVLNTTSNIVITNLANLFLYGLKYTGNNRTGGGVHGTAADTTWCIIENSASGTSVVAHQSNSVMRNVVMRCTGTSYSCCTDLPGSGSYNVRLEGNPSATTGNRRGISTSNNAFFISHAFTIIGHVGDGFLNSGVVSGAYFRLSRSVVYSNSGDGIDFAATTGTVSCWLERSVIVANGAWGVNANTSSNWTITGCRLRNNTSGDITNTGDNPIDINNDTSAGTDADEFVNVSGAVSTWDLRIKNTSSKCGKGFGVADQPAAGGGAAGFPLGRLVI